uniref:Protein MEI2-like 2 n=1 Tax=Rhizophora mucronata TaxID=61149 RepID=A0A2P2IZW4_RHIMU
MWVTLSSIWCLLHKSFPSMRFIFTSSLYD